MSAGQISSSSRSDRRQASGSELIAELRTNRDKLSKALDKAESMHDSLEEQAQFLTSTGADLMADVRACCDALELSVSDECWPLPKYREMLFPV